MKKQEEEPTIKVVTQQEMVKILMQLKGATPATIEAITPVKMNKKNNPYHDSIFKTQRSNVFINFNYTAAVNRQLVKEGKEPNFIPSPRVWGVKLPGVPIVCHNEKYYVEVRFLGSDPHIEYWYNSEPIDEDIFKQYLPPHKDNKEHQGVKNDIVLRLFSIESIQSMVFKHTKYIISGK